MILLLVSLFTFIYHYLASGWEPRERIQFLSIIFSLTTHLRVLGISRLSERLNCLATTSAECSTRVLRSLIFSTVKIMNSSYGIFFHQQNISILTVFLLILSGYLFFIRVASTLGTSWDMGAFSGKPIPAV